MSKLQLLKTNKTNLMLRSDKGELKHVEATVYYSWCFEYNTPDFDYGTKEENDKELQRFVTGELNHVMIKVAVECLGETGTDILGGCFISDKNFENEILNTAAEHDMKNNACLELKNNIEYQWNKFKEVLL